MIIKSLKFEIYLDQLLDDSNTMILILIIMMKFERSSINYYIIKNILKIYKKKKYVCLKIIKKNTLFLLIFIYYLIHL